MEDENARGPGRIGRDELNIAEFPITLLTEKHSKGAKTLTFEGKQGRLTITGSDDLGLPTAPDADVIIGLIYLTKLRNNFTSPTVTFSRYELLGVLGWQDIGRSYRRLDESLRRWVGVTLRYDKSWYDNSIKCKVDASFHLIDRVVIYDQEVRRTLRERQQTLPLSSFTWGHDFFASCQADNIKRLDLDAYFGLRSAVSKRLYRFLDKRFYVRSEWSFDLRELAFEHVGLSRAYTAAKLKEKLRPALEELEALGFLRVMANAERYVSVGRGQWRIRLARQTAAIVEEPGPEPGGVLNELIVRGVTAATARELVGVFPEDRIKAKIEQAEWLRAKKPGKVKDLGAYVVAAIREDYAPPAGFESVNDRARREAADQEQRRREQERRHQEARAKALEREAEAKVRQFWEGLTASQQERVEAEALENADPDVREGCMGAPKVMQKIMIRSVREAHIRRLLDLPAAG